MAEKIENLAYWRLANNWNQTQLGDMVSRGQKTISAYETGGLPIPEDVLLKLRALGYNGPIVTKQNPLGVRVVGMDQILDTAEEMISEWKKRGLKSDPDLLPELRKAIVSELEKAAKTGDLESGKDQAARWLRLLALKRQGSR